MSEVLMKPRPKANGVTPPATAAPEAQAGEVSFSGWDFPGHRPYVSGRFTLSKLLEVELAKADAELSFIRANIQAMQMREAELIDMRDTALQGIGMLTRRREPDNDERPADE